MSPQSLSSRILISLIRLSHQRNLKISHVLNFYFGILKCCFTFHHSHFHVLTISFLGDLTHLFHLSKKCDICHINKNVTFVTYMGGGCLLSGDILKTGFLAPKNLVPFLKRLCDSNYWSSSSHSYFMLGPNFGPNLTPDFELT